MAYIKFLNLPDWLYFPFKLLLLTCFFVPILLWAGQILGYSKAQEASFTKKALQNAESETGVVMKYLSREHDMIASRAATALERMTGEEKRLSAMAQQEIAAAKRAAGAQSPAGHVESAKGIDVSHYQGRVRWDRVALSGIHFAFAKATGGEHYVDSRFHENWHGMRTAEIYRGAYHFYYADEDPVAQAEHFIATIRKLRPMDLPPVLDVEIADHADKEKIVRGALIWLRTVEKALGRRPILYTDDGFGGRFLTDRRFSGYLLWIAEYAEQVKTLPAPWKKEGWTFWQHSQTGAIPGIAGNVDLNVFNGSVADLKRLIAASQKRQEPE